MRNTRINLYRYKKKSGMTLGKLIKGTITLLAIATFSLFIYQNKSALRQYISMSKAKALALPTSQFSDLPTESHFKRLIADMTLREFTVQHSDRRIQIQLQTADYFVVGTSNIKPSKLKSMKDLSVALNALSPNYQISVECHTDDIPVVKNKKIYKSNWELSAYRAFSIIHLLEKSGFDKDQLLGVGHGESRPIVPNRDSQGNPIPENQYRNGRMTITLVPKSMTGGTLQ